MKSAIFRTVRQWPFWVVLALCFLSPIILSINYVKNSEKSNYRWDWEVKEYGSSEEIDAQIIELIGAKSYLEENENIDKESVKKEYEYVIGSINILNYLKNNGYKYNEILDGNLVIDHKKDQRSFSRYYITYFYYSMVLFLIIITWMISGAPNTNGWFVMNHIINGRKKVFYDEIVASLFALVTMFIVQTVSFSVMRYVFPGKGKWLLFYNSGKIVVLSEEKEFLLLLLSLFFVLLTFEILFFAIIHFVSNIYGYALVALIASGGIIALANSDWAIWGWCAFTLSPIHYQGNITGKVYVVISLMRLLVAAGIGLGAYWYYKRRSISLLNS